MAIDERRSDCVHYDDCLWQAARKDHRHMKCGRCDKYEAIQDDTYAPELFDTMTKGEGNPMETRAEYKTAEAQEATPAVETKKCSQCGEVKPLEAFHFSQKGLQGRDSKCRACKAINSKAWAEKRGGWKAVRKNRAAARANPPAKAPTAENTAEFPQIRCRPLVTGDTKLASFDRERLARAIGIMEAIMPEIADVHTMLGKASVVIAVYRNLD